MNRLFNFRTFGMIGIYFFIMVFITQLRLWFARQLNKLMSPISPYPAVYTPLSYTLACTLPSGNVTSTKTSLESVPAPQRSCPNSRQDGLSLTQDELITFGKDGQRQML
jgi:hypothetical protein